MTLLLAAALAASLTAIGPGGDPLLVLTAHAHGQPAHRKPVTAPVLDAFGRPGDPAKATRVLEVGAREMAFDRAELRVTRGETVRFVLRNDGQVAHEFAIGDAAAQLAHRRAMAAGHGAGHAHANAVEAAPGARGELVWEFTRAGRFLFACNLPGHAEAGMVGAVVVD